MSFYNNDTKDFNFDNIDIGNDMNNFDNNSRKRPRLVQKCGELNINTNKVPKRNRRLLSDIFNTILDIKWRWHLIIFILSFAISWFFFAIIWYLIAYIHDDIEYDISYHNNLKNLTMTNNNKNNKIPCVSGVHDFTSALLYSIETQHTIGYGHRHITEECPFAIIFLMLQSCIGMFVQGLVAGVVFAKLSRPNKRKRTIIFSNNAVVTERDGKLCFLFKIGNIRISQLSDARIRLIMIKSRLTKEGEFIPFQSYDCKVGQEWSGLNTIFFPFPKIIEHIIDENSPLSEILVSNNRTNIHSNNNNIENIDDYEIVVILEGNIETTGASTHIRTSYLPEEILWGYRFASTYPYYNNNGYSFDFSKFNQVEPVNANLFYLNRNNTYSKIFSKINKTSKNYTKSLPSSTYAFLRPTNTIPTATQLNTYSTNKFSSKKTLESIFSTFEIIKLKSKKCSLGDSHSNCTNQNDSKIKKDISNNNLPIKNGRFTIVPVIDNIQTYDETINQKINDVTDKLLKTNNQTINDSTITSFHFDEGYLTCKQVDIKKDNSDNQYFK